MNTSQEFIQPLVTILDALDDGIIASDKTGKIVYANTVGAEIIGVSSADDLSGMSLTQAMQQVEVCDEKGVPFSLSRWQHLSSETTRLSFRSGQTGMEHRVSVTAKTLHDGELIVYTLREITQHEQVVQTPRRERELLQKIFDHIPVMIAIYEPNTKVLQLNREFERLTGWSSEGAPLDNLMEQCYPDPEYRAWVRAYMDSLQEGWQDIVMTTHDGNLLDSAWSNIRLTNDTHVGIGIDIQARKQAEEQVRQRLAQLQAIHDLNNAVSRAEALEHIYLIALEGLVDHLGADRASILLFDPDGVMRFKAWRGLSDSYRQQTEGHSPWSQDTQNPIPVLVADVKEESSLANLQEVILGEGIRALGFVPLVSEGKLLGKFMIYYDCPHQFSDTEVQFAQTLASHIAFAIERKSIEQERLELLQREHHARLQAEKADALKLQFLAMITHELRTPLTSIKGFASTLLAEDVSFDAPTQHQFITTIDKEADKLKELIDQLIDISRLQAGNLRIDLVRQTLENIIEVARAQLQALTHHHILQLDIPQDLPAVMADEHRIAQVLVNLVDNAVKYSPAETQVTVRVSKMDNLIQIDVMDEGEGIPPDEWNNVFEAFRQIHQKASQSGAGLGLAICKGLVEAHGGNIWIKGNAPRGTVVSFTLPIR